MKHTPGPWKVCRGANSWFVTAPSEAGAYSDATIAEFREVSHGAMHAHRAEHDARLFAAAPGLLAERDALRELMNVYNLGGWTDAVAPMERALAAEAERDAFIAERGSVLTIATELREENETLRALLTRWRKSLAQSLTDLTLARDTDAALQEKAIGK
jgi:hypothetical protein